MDEAARGQKGIGAAALRVGVTLFYRLRRHLWRPDFRGVRGIPVTPDGRLVLVRHTYVPGWHFPGGGYKSGEAPEAAMLRELREEIGMTGHNAIEHFADYRHRAEAKRDSLAFFIIHDVEFAPRLSLEIAEIGAFAPDALPEDMSPATQRRVAEWLGDVAIAREW